MAKPKDETAPVAQGPVVAAVAQVIYRDTLYTSRTLILPTDGRSLPVLKARVAVLATDAEALAYLDGSAEFELLGE
ncbi:hypothetical protein GHO35_13425 [Pseudomonas helleri]|nr:hypothetical protein [Pseudomonas helleri]